MKVVINKEEYERIEKAKADRLKAVFKKAVPLSLLHCLPVFAVLFFMEPSLKINMYGINAFLQSIFEILMIAILTCYLPALFAAWILYAPPGNKIRKLQITGIVLFYSVYFSGLFGIVNYTF